MRYWWVNQNQTYTAEIAGGYVWSPKRRADGAQNQFYENMREVAPGDVVFSFNNTLIAALGIAASTCFEAPKPAEFGAQWSNLGWKVNVDWHIVEQPIRPKDHINRLRPHLPPKYSPLGEDGNGRQAVYLAEIGDGFANELLALVRENGNSVAFLDADMRASILAGRMEAERAAIDAVVERELSESPIEETEKEQLIMSRRGQGRFRQRVAQVERRCRVTHIDAPAFLIASHIKPWRVCNNDERIDGNNGLLLAPHIDFLFDRGYISFEDNGDLIRSPVLDVGVLTRFGLPADGPVNCGTFTEGQRAYLAHHRREVLLRADRA